MALARGIGQWAFLFIQVAEPGKAVWGASQFGKVLQLCEMGIEERQKATGGISISADCSRAQGGREGSVANPNIRARGVVCFRD